MGRRLRVLAQAAIIVAAAVFVYAPVFHGARLWDDKIDFPVARLPLGWAGWKLIWGGTIGLDYYPVKASVQWLEWRLWHDHPLGFHLTNVGLHALAALLFWRVLGKLQRLTTEQGASLAPWAAALLFTVHPLAVESVAWLSEIKNVISLPLLLLAVSAYIDFAEGDAGSASSGGRRRHLAYALAWFVAAMLCKSSVVMFPVVTLLYCWWRRGRINGRDLLASVPFFAASLGFGLVEMHYQKLQLMGTPYPSISLLTRLAAAGMAVLFYFFKSVVPAGFLAIYPRWHLSPPPLCALLPWFAVSAIAAWLWRVARGRPPRRESTGGWAWHGLFGLGFYFVNLIPVLGLVPMGYQHLSWVADHFAYISLLGPIGFAALAFPAWGRRWAAVASGSALAVVVVALALTGRSYAAHFRSDAALWTYTLQGNPDAWLARNALGQTLVESGDSPAALAQFREALRLRPDYAEAHNNLAMALAASGKFAEAWPHFQASLESNPHLAVAANNWGNALRQAGQLPEALQRYRQALAIDPQLAEAHYNFGIGLSESDRLPEAVGEFVTALRLRPDLAVAREKLAAAHNALSEISLQKGDTQAAIAHGRIAVDLQPRNARACNNLGVALATAGRWKEAVAMLRAAVALDPGFAGARDNLDTALKAEAQKAGGR